MALRLRQANGKRAAVKAFAESRGLFPPDRAIAQEEIFWPVLAVILAVSAAYVCAIADGLTTFAIV